MPFTINGIGTTYYGKQNRESFPGCCGSCGAETQLENYQTRLWFTVFFIPLVPLAKKQILNYCPRCTKHYAPSQTEWKRVQDESIQQDLSTLAGDPESAEASLKLFGTLTTFKRKDEADDLAKAMLARYGQRVDVLVNVASWYDQTNRKPEGDALFQKALKLEPENLMLKRAVALGFLENNDPNRARQLLEATPPFTAGDDAFVYFQLGKVYQAQGQHDAALEAFSQVQKAHPNLGRDKPFRAAVRASEKVSPVTKSMLPPVSLFSRRAFWIPAIVAIVVAGVLGLNAYLAGNRTIYVVNGFDEQVEVRIDGGAAITVAKDSHRTIKLSLGEHTIVTRLAGKDLPEDKFQLSGGFPAGFTGGTFVLNAGRGAVVFWEETKYSARAANNAGEGRPNYQLFVGQPFYRLSGIDYAFAEFPREIRVKGNSTTTRRRCDVEREVTPVEVLTGTLAGVSDDDLFSFAEAHLKANPNNESLLAAYSAIAIAKKRTDSCRDFLKQGLTERPILIEWHRAYQHLARIDKTGEKVKAEYEKLLAAEPDNGALLYLVGRMERDSNRAESFYERSIAADPKSPFPWRSKAYHQQSRGDLAEALKSIESAVQLAPQDAAVAHFKREILSSLGQWDAVERELDRANKNPGEGPSELHGEYMIALVAAGKIKQAEERQTEIEAQLQKIQAKPEIIRASRIKLDYMLGRFAAVKTLAQENLSAEQAAQSVGSANLELGQVKEAAENFRAAGMFDEWVTQLLLSIAWTNAGNQGEADRCLKQALVKLREGTQDEQTAAALLEKRAEIAFADARNLILEPRPKAILLVVAAQAAPSAKGELLGLAEKLNYDRNFPHHLLKRTIDNLKTKD